MRVNHLQVISSYWNKVAEEYNRTHPEHLDDSMHPSWGLWHVPEKNLHILDRESLKEKKMLDLGCGRGHDSVAYAKLGANVLAVDVSQKQIEQSLQHKNVAYVVASAESIPTPDTSIDIAISDHGAFDHSPASPILREMRRILVPGGKLVICTYSPLSYCCYDEETGKLLSRLIRAYPNSVVQYDGEVINAQYSYSTWVRLFEEHGFYIERLEELIIPLDTKDYFDELVDVSWASCWPCDIIWLLRKKL